VTLQGVKPTGLPLVEKPPKLVFFKRTAAAAAAAAAAEPTHSAYCQKEKLCSEYFYSWT
jgi:hypothetical protein